MIYLWTAKIRAEIPGNVEPCSDLAVKKFLFGDFETNKIPNPNRLATIYMFKHLEIRNPVYGAQLDDGRIMIQPGWNRYIGASMRQRETWIDAKICTKDDIFPTPNIRWIECVSRIKGKDSLTTAVKLGKKECGKGSQPEARSFLIEKSKNARIELKLNKEQLIFNPTGNWVISVDTRDFNGVIPALKEIYNIVDSI